VIADLDDSSAWEDPIFVPPSKSTFTKPDYDFSKGKRGAVLPPEHGKTRITIRTLPAAGITKPR
jgi:hypothetical protein